MHYLNSDAPCAFHGIIFQLFPLKVEGRILVLIVHVPGHCLFSTFQTLQDEMYSRKATNFFN